MASDSKSTWGGRRVPGPGKRLGPPPLPPEEKRVKLGITLPPWLARWLKARHATTGETASQAVERALKEHYGLEGPEGKAE